MVEPATLTVKLVRGLPRERLLEEIYFHHRSGEAARRALAFYLLELHERREYLALGYSSTVAFAEATLDLTRRETRELLRVARALEDLPLLDAAFGRGEISWGKLNSPSEDDPCGSSAPSINDLRQPERENGAKVLPEASEGALGGASPEPAGEVSPGGRPFPGRSEDDPCGSSAPSINDLRQRAGAAGGLSGSALRPRRLADFVGQRRLVSNLELAIEAARARGEPLGHLLLGGPAGLGKTTLARLVAGAMEARFHPAAGPHLEEPQQLIALLAGLGAGGVLFIDEVHGLPKPCEECLFSALEDGVIDVVVTNGSRSRTVRIALEPFTLVAATTEVGALAEPFRARFKLQETLELYEREELAHLVERAAPRLALAVSPEAAAAIARRARRTPREALRLLERARDLATVAGRRALEAPDVEETARRLAIDEDGLGPVDRRILALLLSSPRPLGLEAMAAALHLDSRTLKLVHEPYLVEQGYVHRGPRGREAGARARRRFQGLGRVDGRTQVRGIPILGSLRRISIERLGRGPAGA